MYQKDTLIICKKTEIEQKYPVIIRFCIIESWYANCSKTVGQEDYEKLFTEINENKSLRQKWVNKIPMNK